MANEPKRPRAVDLFCGAGGMSAGFEQAGFDIVFAVDADGHHVATHRRNFPNHPTVCRSITELSASDIFDAIGGRQDVDLVFGGPPCQGFSTMGLRDAQDPRNSLVHHFVRLVTELRPKAFAMENVPGMAAGKTKDLLEWVVESLETCGYLIAKPIKVLDASDFGVPQKRRRLFVLGVRSDAGVCPAYPCGPRRGQPCRPTILDAIRDLPDVDGNDGLFLRDWTKYDREPDSAYAKVARGAVEDPTDYSYPRLWETDLCTGCLRVRHTPKAVELYSATPPGRNVPGHKLPRLDPEGICPTLRAGSDSTHGSYTAPRPIHPRRPRCITAREAARLHGFPDWFAFFPTKWHAYRQIGNAVCPPVARAVGFSIMSALDLVPCKPKKSVELLSEFELPNDRPRSLRRIPHIRNYPPVIQYLFANAFDDDQQRLWRAKFSFADVQQAIKATRVSLPWVRADTFVQEIARSRNIRQILEPCLRFGYSIAPLEGDFIGEFRAEDQPGTITERDTIEVRSSEVANALVVKTGGPLDLCSPQSVAKLFQQAKVTESLWHKGISVRLAPHAFTGSRNRVAEYHLVNGSGRGEVGILALLAHGSQPTKSRLQRLLRVPNRSEVVVVLPVTGRHVLAIRYDVAAGFLREAARQAYRIDNPEQVERSSIRRSRSGSRK